jgi:cobalt-zinc-cadmium efflux system protein
MAIAPTATITITWARRIARRPADDRMTYGYGRAEVVAALVNYTTLIVLGLHLVIEAILRLIAPEPVQGWLVVAIAGVALAVDVATAALTYAMSRHSMNFRAAFLHNVADALGSVGVIVAGAVIILFDWRLVDPIVTLLIAGYILWHAVSEIGGAIRLLMMAAPRDIDIRAVVAALRDLDGVVDVHHVHLWSIDERQASLEAHVVVADGTGRDAAALRRRIRATCRERFGILHATIEVEHAADRCEGRDTMVVGHRHAAPRADPDRHGTGPAEA